jgi:hypothetical protein
LAWWREHEGLSFDRHSTEEPTYIGKEAEIKHVVGFIEDENGKVVELYIPTLDMIQEPSSALR